MRLFAIWLAMTLAIFGLFAGCYHWYLTNHPRRILVIVESSFPMRPVWPHVQAEVRNLSDRPYTFFALVTEKERIHGWQSRPDLGTVTPYAPRDIQKFLTEVARYPELGAATEIHLLTNAAELESQSPDGWIVHMLISSD